MVSQSPNTTPGQLSCQEAIHCVAVVPACEPRCPFPRHFARSNRVRRLCKHARRYLPRVGLTTSWQRGDMTVSSWPRYDRSLARYEAVRVKQSVPREDGGGSWLDMGDAQEEK